MATRNRKCLSCTTEYKYCPDCSRVDKLAPSWKAQFCCESCKDLWLTATKFNMNNMTREEAKSVILGLDLKPIDAYAVCVQRDLKNIMAEDKKPKRGKRAEMKILDETMEIEQEVVASVVTDTVEIKHEQQIEVVEQVEIEPTAHEVVIEKEKE